MNASVKPVTIQINKQEFKLAKILLEQKHFPTNMVELFCEIVHITPSVLDNGFRLKLVDKISRRVTYDK